MAAANASLTSRLISNCVSVSKIRIAPISRFVTPPARQSNGSSHFGSARWLWPSAMRKRTTSVEVEWGPDASGPLDPFAWGLSAPALGLSFRGALSRCTGAGA